MVWFLFALMLAMSLPTTVFAQAHPAITSFTPSSGPVGTAISVTGSGFTGATYAKVSYVTDAGLSVTSDTQATITVPADAPLGSATIAIANASFIGYSNGHFTVTSSSDTTPPTAPSGLTATVISATQINLSWTASTDNVGVTGYRVERCSGASCTTFAQIGTPTATTYNDMGLAPSTSYSYRVRATDAAGNLSSYSSTAGASTTADTTAPTAPSGLTTTVISPTQINLSWTASSDNVGVAGYRVERCSGASCTTFAQVATPSTTTYNDTGLTSATSYSYRVRATDAAGNLSSYSSTASGTTSADTTAPTAPGTPTLTVVSSSQINLGWTASTDNIGVTGYRVERCSGASCTTFAQVATPAATTYNDTSLTASTSYSYRVRATDAAGNLSSYSSTASATTQSGSYPHPAITSFTPSTGPSGTAISVTGSGFTGATYAKVSYVTDAGLTVTSDTHATITVPADAPLGSGTIAVANPSYTGYSSSSFTVTSASDTTPPTAPTGLTATVASSTQINLSWTASTDNVGVTGYRVESCSGASCTTFAQIGTPTTTTYSATGLTASTSYSFRVRANDAAGNLSGYSNTATGTTQSVVDTTPPTPPTGLSASVVSSSQITLSWSASTDNVGVAGYRVERCQGAGCSNFTQVGTPSGTSYSDVGLTASTSYTYRIRASDAAGNLSGYSGTASGTTISGANSYSYDANGHVSTITTSTGTARYYYDAAGNVTSIVWTIP